MRPRRLTVIDKQFNLAVHPDGIFPAAVFRERHRAVDVADQECHPFNMERLRHIRADRPALPGALLRGNVDAVDVPQRAVDARIVAQADITAAHRRAAHDLLRQQAHWQAIGHQRQQTGRAQGQHQGRDKNARRFKEPANAVHNAGRFTAGDRHFIPIGHINENLATFARRERQLFDGNRRR